MPSNRPIPVLWLCGPSGVGKSTVGWELSTQLNAAGISTAYLDLDQIGLCYPAPAEDPDNHRIKVRNLAAMWPAYRSAGAECLVLSGGVVTPELVRSYAEPLRGTELTLCRLRVGHDALRARIEHRGWLTHLADESVAEADALDRSDFADLTVDTDGLPVAEVARRVRAAAGDRLRPGSAADAAAAARGPVAGVGPHPGDRAATAAPAPALWLCGPTGVGKSTVGYDLFTQVRTGGVKAAYVDLGQIGFLRPAPVDDPGNHRLKAANLGVMWPVFREHGARCLIVSGPVDDRDVVGTYRDALPDLELTLCLLTAEQQQLTERILRRGRGGGPPIPGDELRGLPEPALRRVAERAGHQADALTRAGFAHLNVATDGIPPAELAALVRNRAGGNWPGLPVDPDRR